MSTKKKSTGKGTPSIGSFISFSEVSSSSFKEENLPNGNEDSGGGGRVKGGGGGDGVSSNSISFFPFHVPFSMYQLLV